MTSKAKLFPAGLDLEKQRAVGIENELYSRGKLNYSRPSPKVYKEIAGRIGRESHADCGAIEYTTKPLRLSYIRKNRGKEQLLSYYQKLAGVSKVSPRNGTHVHISLMDTDHPDLEARVLVITTQFYKQIQKIAGRDSPQWAKSPGTESMKKAKDVLKSRRISPATVPQYVKLQRQSYFRAFLIITPTPRHTLEFRGPKGTLDPTEVLAWIDLLENIVRVCNRKKLKTLHIKEILKGEYLEPYVEKLVKKKKLTKSDLEAKITKGLE